MSKNILLFVVILLLASFVHADTTVLLYSDNFDSAALDTVAWNVNNKSNVTIDQIGGKLRFNGTHTDTTLDGSWSELQYPINQSDSFTVEWSYQSPNGSIVDTFTGVEISSRDHAGSRISTPPTWCGIWVGQQVGSFIIGKGFPNALSIATIAAADASEHDFKVTGTRGSTSVTYQIYYDSSLITTYEQNCTGTFDASLFLASTSGIIKTVYFDDFSLSTITTGNFTGAGCNKNTDCASGKCEYGFCALKLGRESCESDSQCYSLECSNNKCTDIDFADKLTLSKNQWFGTGMATSTLLVLIVGLFIAVSIIVSARGQVAGIIAGVIALYGVVFVGAIFGWVHLFLVIGMIIAAIGSGVLFLVFGGGDA